MGGLSAWIVWKLDAELQSLTHLMRDSFQFRSELHNTAKPEDAKRVAIDLKDFFLWGEPSILASDCTKGSGDPMVWEAILPALNHQYVKSSTSEFHHQCFKVEGYVFVSASGKLSIV